MSARELTNRAGRNVPRRRGATIWFTGLPAAGKSTLATAVEARLAADGHAAYVLDGDELRRGLCADLDFSPAGRAENVRRVAHLARMLADAGCVAIAALVSPYAEDRRLAREVHERDGLTFIEVFVNTPLDVCMSRDPKGLYARARSGDLVNLTGYSDPYECPEAADVELNGALDIEAAAEVVISALTARLPT